MCWLYLMPISGQWGCAYTHSILCSIGKWRSPMIQWWTVPGLWLHEIRNSPQLKTVGAWGCWTDLVLRGLGKYIFFLLSLRQKWAGTAPTTWENICFAWRWALSSPRTDLWYIFISIPTATNSFSTGKFPPLCRRDACESSVTVVYTPYRHVHESLCCLNGGTLWEPWYLFYPCGVILMNLVDFGSTQWVLVTFFLLLMYMNLTQGPPFVVLPRDTF